MTKARKEHTCAACGGVIAKGEEYINKERANVSGQYRRFPEYDSLHPGCVTLFEQHGSIKAAQFYAKVTTQALCRHSWEDTPSGAKRCVLCGWIKHQQAGHGGHKRTMRGLR